MIDGHGAYPLPPPPRPALCSLGWDGGGFMARAMFIPWKTLGGARGRIRGVDGR